MNGSYKLKNIFNNRTILSIVELSQINENKVDPHPPTNYTSDWYVWKYSWKT